MGLPNIRALSSEIGNSGNSGYGNRDRNTDQISIFRYSVLDYPKSSYKKDVELKRQRISSVMSERPSKRVC